MTDDREFLRSELLAVAAAVVPDQQAVVTHDPGPVNPGVLFDGRGTATVYRVTVETGDPKAPDPAAAVDAAAAAFRARGWTADVVPPENGHYRVAASRDGFDVAVHAWSADWRITFTGETPVVS
jgi:phage-related baseplate assembly protein